MAISTGHNTGFASGGVTCKLEALCFYLISVLFDSFALQNPPERKAQKRYRQVLADRFQFEYFLFSAVQKMNANIRHSTTISVCHKLTILLNVFKVNFTCKFF